MWTKSALAYTSGLSSPSVTTTRTVMKTRPHCITCGWCVSTPHAPPPTVPPYATTTSASHKTCLNPFVPGPRVLNQAPPLGARTVVELDGVNANMTSLGYTLLGVNHVDVVLQNHFEKENLRMVCFAAALDHVCGGIYVSRELHDIIEPVSKRLPSTDRDRKMNEEKTWRQKTPTYGRYGEIPPFPPFPLISNPCFPLCSHSPSFPPVPSSPYMCQV